MKQKISSDNIKSMINSNAEICIRVTDYIRSTLGPCSMSKVFFSKETNIITNDGATILNTLNIPHPISKILVEISKSQDFEVGDGTTSVCILATELIIMAKYLIEEGLCVNLVNKGFRKSCIICIQMINEISKKIENTNAKTIKKSLMSCCATSLNSKLISTKRHIFSEMIVNICIYMGEEFDLNMISVKNITGGCINDSFFIKGIGIKKPFSYAGSEKQFKKYYFPKILVTDIELEIKPEKNNAESKIKYIQDFQAIIDAEWSIIYEKLDKICKSKIKAVFSKSSIGDLSTQYFAERGVLCGGRISSDDVNRIAIGTCAQIISSISDINDFTLGRCNLIEERQIGEERFLILSGCKSESVTIILRGASDNLLQEIKRCLNDGIMIVKKTIKNQTIVGGAGSIEMHLSCKLRKYANSLTGQNQLIVSKYARALEIIPKTICENAGLDFMNMVSKLRYLHTNSLNWAGIDIEKGKILNSYQNYIWEPSLTKISILQAATEAACSILTIDSML
ncbi:t-complex protein1 eta SU (nucleomorph) [Cryptomonas paramecium]|uniref:CCT-eta n=1 Tax=Cryptomonas paramaecium TaxID=2898 RepID=F2HHW2_9CRYP|nr:t-complex protein1 eta SU [Cryptomonas paramecium]AEA38908.1 t-complex protein1 eta SU [Cryptomonas paramecium]|mmetsp:Transcript_37052/g.98546  ORF Transcript_37052/g.98546 Transcript_37052/m.98546 type:complete len:511 (-) Transcript_37052:9218-10750(-)